MRNKFQQWYDKLAVRLLFHREGVNIRNYRIYGRLFVNNQGHISIGNNFTANSGIAFTPIGGDTILKLVTTKDGVLKIGENVGMSNSTIYCADNIVIGDYVLIGNSCKIWDTDFHSTDPEERCFKGDRHIVTKPVTIGNKVFIGGGVTILKGVTIGENSIIGAESVVTKSIPPNQIWGGNPAKFIRNL